MNKTAVFVCRREEVCVKTFGGVKVGSVAMSQMTPIAKRRFNARDVFGGTGCGCMDGGAWRLR